MKVIRVVSNEYRAAGTGRHSDLRCRIEGLLQPLDDYLYGCDITLQGRNAYQRAKDATISALVGVSTRPIRTIEDFNRDVADAMVPFHEYVKGARCDIVNLPSVWPGYPKTRAQVIASLQSALIAETAEEMTVEEARIRYPQTPNVVCGGMHYTTSPANESALVPIQGFFDEVSHLREMELLDLLRRMGARTIHVIEQNGDRESGSFQIDVGAPVAAVGVGASCSVRSETDISKRLVVSLTGRTDPGLSMAALQDLMWNRDNAEIQTMLRGRVPGTSSRIQNWTFEYSYRSTFGFDFALAAQFLGVATVDLKGEYDRVAQRTRRFVVDFGD